MLRNTRTGPRPAAWLVACALTGSAVAQTTTYKDDKNPTGVPDIDQVGATCAAASWADSLWYMNQHKPKLGIKTGEKPWEPEAKKIYDKMNDFYYTKSRGDQAPIMYAYETNKDDFSPATDKKYPNNQAPFVSQWAVQNFHWKKYADAKGKLGPGHDLAAEAAATFGTNRIATLGIFLHDKNKGAADFKVPLAGNKEGLWAHAMVYAGHDLNKDKALTHTYLAHGWNGPDKDVNVAVSKDYYNRYTTSVDTPGVDGYHANRMRITDDTFYGTGLGKGNPAGLAKPEDIDYAQVHNVRVLRTDFQSRYSFSYFTQKESVDDFRGRHAIENFGEGPITEIALELPLINPKDPSWINSLQLVEVPSGWDVTVWDPSKTEYLTPGLDADENGILELGFAGLLLSAADGFALNDLDESLILEYKIDPAFLVSTQGLETLMFAVGDSGRGYYAQSLGVAIPAPATGLALIALGLVASRRRRGS